MRKSSSSLVIFIAIFAGCAAPNESPAQAGQPSEISLHGVGSALRMDLEFANSFDSSISLDVDLDLAKTADLSPPLDSPCFGLLKLEGDHLVSHYPIAWQGVILRAEEISIDQRATPFGYSIHSKTLALFSGAGAERSDQAYFVFSDLEKWGNSGSISLVADTNVTVTNMEEVDFECLTEFHQTRGGTLTCQTTCNGEALYFEPKSANLDYVRFLPSMSEAFTATIFTQEAKIQVKSSDDDLTSPIPLQSPLTHIVIDSFEGKYLPRIMMLSVGP